MIISLVKHFKLQRHSTGADIDTKVQEQSTIARKKLLLDEFVRDLLIDGA